MSASDPHVGVVLPTREALRSGRAGFVASFARLAESRGLGSLWAGDSLLARPLLDPLTALATAAAVTTKPLLGTGVLLAPMRPPALTAQALASLDQLSNGRLVVGIGRGFDLPDTRREFAAAGADFQQRTRRTIDTIAFWRALWSTDGVASMDTSYARLDAETILPRPVQGAGPPIWLAGFGPAAFKHVGRHGDGWLPYPPDADDYRTGLEHVHKAAETAGRDPTTITPAMMATVHIAPRAVGEPALADYVAQFYGYSFDLVSSIQACRAGTGEEILDFLRGYWEAGARTFVLRLASLDDPQDQLLALAEEVLPIVKSWINEIPA